MACGLDSKTSSINSNWGKRTGKHMSTRLLICDDSSFSRKSIKKSLPEEMDLEVDEVGLGEEAIALCSEGKVDLLFLDLNMPGMDGFQVLEQLRDQGFSSPIIVITANIQSAPSKRAKDLGARAVLQKPINQQKVSQLMSYLAKEGSL